jgi:hypothetical protein
MTTFVAPIQNQWGRQIDTTLQRNVQWRIPQTIVDNVPSAPGSFFWSATNLTVFLANSDEGDETAWASSGASSSSTNLYVSNYGFNIPTGATILGIEVSVVAGSTWTANTLENTVRLAMAASAGTLSTDNKASGAARTPLSAVTYGGAADLWGESTATLTPAVINSSNFGIVYRVNATATSQTASVRRLGIRVTYSATEDGNVRISHEYAEVLVQKTEPVRLTQTYAEVLTVKSEPVRATQVYAEVLRSVADSVARKRRMLILQGTF